jgi:glycosyltransferase involved in cell wall biosynthesis
LAKEKKIKRIYIISGKCPANDEDPLIGGAEKVPYRIAKYLHAYEDLDVKFLYFKGPRVEDAQKILIQALPGKLYFSTIFRELAILFNHKIILSSDILQIHHPHYAVMAGLMRKITGKKIKIIVKAHGTASPEFNTLRAKGLRGLILKINNWLHHKHDKLALRLADLCICSSEFQKREMVELYNVTPSKLVTIYNGYDPDYFPSLGVKKLNNSILIVARAVPKKNIKYTFEIFKRLYDVDNNFTLTVVAGGKSRNEDPETSKFLQSTLPLHEGVSVYYDLSERELAKLYASSEYFLCPSIDYESIPSVLYEAMASGCKIFATKAWGIPEILPPDSFLTHDINEDVQIILGAKTNSVKYKTGKYSYSSLVKLYRELYV